MKRILMVLAGLVLAYPAFAAMNLQQRDDGTAEWRGKDGDKGNCVGGQFMTFRVALSALTTDYGVSAITNALIRNAWIVSNVTSTGTAVLTFWSGQNTITPVRFIDRSASSATAVSLWVSPASPGDVYTISTLRQAGADAIVNGGNPPIGIEAGSALAVQSDGQASVSGGVSQSQVVLHLCPR